MANTTTLVKPLFEHARKVPFNIAPAQGARLASEMFRKKGWVFLNEAEIGQGSDHPPAFKVSVSAVRRSRTPPTCSR